MVDRFLDCGEPFGDPPSTAQGFWHQELDEPKNGGPRFAEFVKAGAQQRQSCVNIAALNNECSLTTAAPGRPERL
jgi:hypothetical protein